ncbi:HU family DNA-binding protein [Lutimonas zeaxanthinifaciens]|uniref:HU family DNA-binding protein n=1 Tax=Lutimonas zeaxanthinifaciens TaxID=3060215 RepID=UPI00265C9713|nr:HU family DNA-binding protein [Lutimonas sp. YSD2104]WKK67594.1 HU family DNA-binding protein [Lutimonas sp. YSD2104]
MERQKNEYLTNFKFLIMNKSDLIESMATNAGISKAAAGKALDGMMKSITGELMTGGRVSLVGFGSFSVSTRAARDGRNPQTGATIKIPARKVVKFKAGSELKDSVN